MRNNRNSSDFNNVPMQEMVSTELSPMCLRDTEVSQDLPNKLNGDDQLGDCEHMMNPFLT